MTRAERKRASRAKQAAEGCCDLTIQLRGGMLAFINRFSEAAGISRAETIRQLLEVAILRTGAAIAEADKLMENGASAVEVATLMHERLRIVTTAEAGDRYKEVLGVRP